MELRQIEYACLAAQSGSFSSAAKKAFVTQQTLSASVSSLEHEWGAPLFNRQRQGVQLTEFGKDVLPYCEKLLLAAHELEGFVKHHRVASDEAVTIACATASIPKQGKGLTLSCLSRFQQSHPTVHFSVFEAASDTCLSALENGVADLAIVVDEPDSARFSFTKLIDERLVVECAASNPLAQLEAISFRDLDGIPIFPPFDLGITYRKIVSGFKRYGLKPQFAIALATSDVSSIWQFLRNERGVVFSPYRSTVDLPSDIVFRPLIDTDSITAPYGIAELLGKTLNKPANTLKEFIICCQ